MIRKLLGVLVVVAALCATPGVVPTASAAPAAPAAPSERAERRVVYFDMAGQARVEPRRMFFSASSGTFVKRLEWSAWGTRAATATGVYVSTCASCDPPRYREARIRFSGLRWCAVRDAWYYERGVMWREPSAGQTRRVEISAGSCFARD